MKDKKIIFWGVALIVILLVIGYQFGITQATKKTVNLLIDKAKQIKKDTNEFVSKKDKENKILEDENAIKDEIISGIRDDNLDLILKQKEDAKEMDKLKGIIAKEKPDELISRSRNLLGTDEIWWNKEIERVELSLEAFRIGVDRWADWQNFTLIREPDYKQLIMGAALLDRTQEEKISNLQIEVANFKLISIERQNNYSALSDAFTGLSKLANKKGGLIENLLWGFGGYGLATFFESIKK